MRILQHLHVCCLFQSSRRFTGRFFFFSQSVTVGIISWSVLTSWQLHQRLNDTVAPGCYNLKLEVLHGNKRNSQHFTRLFSSYLVLIVNISTFRDLIASHWTCAAQWLWANYHYFNESYCLKTVLNGKWKTELPLLHFTTCYEDNKQVDCFLTHGWGCKHAFNCIIQVSATILHMFQAISHIMTVKWWENNIGCLYVVLNLLIFVIIYMCGYITWWLHAFYTCILLN